MVYYGVLCWRCGSEIIIDDIDFNFKGNQDEYLICPCCRDAIFVKVRFGKIHSIDRRKLEI